MYIVAQIPLDALAAIGPERPHLAYVLLDLYGVAVERQAAAVDTTMRELGARWSYTDQQISEALEALEALELLEVERLLGGILRIAIPGAQEPEKLPSWARSVPSHGVPRPALVQAVTDAVDAMAWPTCDRPEDARRWPPRRGQWAARGDAKQLLKIWRDHDYRDPARFVRDARLIAYAARECPDPLFARDIRGKGWEGGADRSRSIATLCVTAKWSERLRVAEAWLGTLRQQRDRRPTDTSKPAAAPTSFPNIRRDQ